MKAIEPKIVVEGVRTVTAFDVRIEPRRAEPQGKSTPTPLAFLLCSPCSSASKTSWCWRCRCWWFFCWSVMTTAAGSDHGQSPVQQSPFPRRSSNGCKAPGANGAHRPRGSCSSQIRPSFKHLQYTSKLSLLSPPPACRPTTSLLLLPINPTTSSSGRRRRPPQEQHAQAEPGHLDAIPQELDGALRGPHDPVAGCAAVPGDGVGHPANGRGDGREDVGVQRAVGPAEEGAVCQMRLGCGVVMVHGVGRDWIELAFGVR